MQTIHVEVAMSMGHRLPSYKGICSSPHGHNAKVEVVVETTKFIDFKDVQRDLRVVTDQMDHSMILWKDDPLLPILKNDFEFRTYQLDVEPTTENIAWEIFNKMKDAGYKVRSVTVHETDKYAATVTP